MDDFWAVVWGATIALFASVIGGFMTSVLGPLLARRADERARAKAIAEERRAVLRQAIWDASIALRNYAVTPDSQAAEKYEAMNTVETHMVKIRLWTTHEEGAVADTLGIVMSKDEHAEVMAYAPVWEKAAAQWFRGQIADADFKERFDRAGARAIANSRTKASQQAAEAASDTTPADPSDGQQAQ
ncbi:hypothetical protein [Frigoribacterium sp. VKM Ac-2530]|uniref:hypothetical protein n=1 Tax=Frigoribacterium sp. VKM Ac-2530 TaxID=2783822 RepID=UPI00188D634C|nr:hypothetical protein [Frigoribacterium sp. VKM Ac-2530]MBF4578933.1 hypothetical protein [Frigoribacterium sp. VKM Ac-2530]